LFHHIEFHVGVIPGHKKSENKERHTVLYNVLEFHLEYTRLQHISVWSKHVSSFKLRFSG